MAYALHILQPAEERLGSVERDVRERIRARLEEIAREAREEAPYWRPRVNPLPLLERFDIDGYCVLYERAARSRTIELWAVLEQCLETT